MFFGDPTSFVASPVSIAFLNSWEYGLSIVRERGWYLLPFHMTWILGAVCPMSLKLAAL